MAKQMMPDSPSATDTLGWAYYKGGLRESAVLTLEQCVEKAPKNPTYQFHLGMAWYIMGREQPAREAFA